MFRFEGGKPGDQRGFIHKKLLGIGSKILGVLPIPGAGIASKFTGLLAGGGAPRPLPSDLRFTSTGRQLTSTAFTSRPTAAGAQAKELGRSAKFGGGNGAGGDGCIFPLRRDPGTGECKIFFGERAGPNGGAPVGDAVMGRYGAALQPGIMTIDRSVCLRGMQLGDDGLCYNKSQISNKQRMWPRGRRPLLTGGDMRAIGIASRAGKKLDSTSKRLRALGMMKPLPKARAPAAHKHARAIEAVSV